MKTQGSSEGYLMVDHRASPGIPEDVARKIGYDPKFTGEGKFYEQATLTCEHCKVVVVKNPARVRERAFCHKCMHYVCDPCAAQMHEPQYTHLPFDKLADHVLTQVEHGTPQVLLPTKF